MATHLPQDIGADGFQIVDGDDTDTDFLSDDEDDLTSTFDPTDPDYNGGIIPTKAIKADTSDEALDGVSRLR